MNRDDGVVIEIGQAVAAAYRSFTVAEDVPRESEAGCEILLARVIKRPPDGIPGEISRGVGKYSVDVVVVDKLRGQIQGVTLVQGSVVVVTQSANDGEPLTHFPLIGYISRIRVIQEVPRILRQRDKA